MAASLVPIEDYLKTFSDTHCEYVGGVLIEKPMPTWMHAVLQAWISALVMRKYPQYLAGGEVHARLTKTEFRLPDIAVQRREIVEQETYAERPPVLCVEILSREDQLAAIFEKCERYHRWGVPMCWVIDPVTREAWMFEHGGEPSLERDELVASEIHLALAEVFSVLDAQP
jgi:Uma2 family endonuclease